MIKTRVVLADDHPIVLNGLRNLLRTEDDLDLVGEAMDGLGALRIIREKQPDVAVIDISMPELSGILLSRRLAEEIKNVKVIVLTLHEDRAYVKQALAAGVRGYVLKRSASECLVQAIRAVVIGGLYVDPAIAMHVLDATQRNAGHGRPGVAATELTSREAEVLKQAALGFTNKEIARRLDIGVKSVETYKLRGTAKLGLKSRADLVRYAFAQGWMAPD